MKDKKINIKGTVIAIVAVIAVAALGTFFTDAQSNWYLALNQPGFQVDSMVFPIVWTALYILIVLSLIRLINSGKIVDKKIWLMFSANGILNVLWSFSFFTLQSPIIAFFIVLLLVLQTVFLVRMVWETDALSAVLLLPYLLWLVFAMFLNYAIVILN